MYMSPHEAAYFVLRYYLISLLMFNKTFSNRRLYFKAFRDLILKLLVKVNSCYKQQFNENTLATLYPPPPFLLFRLI